MNPLFVRRTGPGSLLAASLLLGGCFGDDDNNHNSSATDSSRQYEIRVVNATAGQPFSPLTLIAHSAQYHALMPGEAAGTELEQLAEGGNNQPLLTSLSGNNQVFGSLSGDGVVAPGASQTLTLTLTEADASAAYLTLLTMMVNTNDAVVAARSMALANLAVDESWTLTAIAYDAGTEANSETAATIPGPAGGGEGYNAQRDDVADQVTVHPGVITADDGLVTSALAQAHRWDNPAARMTITRSR